jgi:hypothetical protein
MRTDARDKEIEKACNDLPLASQVEAFFQGTDSIRQFVVSVMEPVLFGQLGLDDRQTAIVGTYYRIVAWLKALGELNSLSHYQAVASGARSLFELLLDLKLIQSDSNGEWVKKFHAFPEIEKYRAAEKLVSYCDRTSGTKLDCTNQRKFIDGADKEAAIESLIRQHWGTTRDGEPRWPHNWSGLSAAQRAKKLGPEYDELYIEFYPFLSWHIHSGSTGYAGLKPETLEAGFGLMHSMIQRVVLEATETCAEEMKIDKIDNLAKPFKPTIEDLRNSTDQILLQKHAEFLKQQSRTNQPQTP